MLGGVPILRKIYHSFPHFHLLISTSPMKIFIYSTYPFLLQHPLCPSILILTNHIFFWKSKLKHMGVDITCFFQHAKSSLTKCEKCLLEPSYRTVTHKSWSFLQKKLMAYNKKQFSQKVPP